MRDLHEVDREILDNIDVVPVDTLNDVLDRALMPIESGTQRQRRAAGFVLPVAGRESSPPINA
jgi:hypothetical protein